MAKYKKLCCLITVLLLLSGVLGCAKKAAVQTTGEGAAKEVRVAYIAMPMTAPQPLIGIETKSFEKTLAEKGIKVTWVHTRSLNNIWPMMDKDEVDFAYLPSNNFSSYITETSKFGGTDKFRVIAGSLNHDLFIFMAKPDIKTLKDLDGKKVGIVNHFYQEEMMLNKQLEQVGLKTKALGGTVDVEYVDMMGDFINNFAQGKYAAVCTWSEQQSAIENKVPGARVLTNLNAGMFGRIIPQNWLVAKEQLLKNDPDTVKAVLNAHVDATEAALKQKDSLSVKAGQAYDNYFVNEIKSRTYPKLPESYLGKDWADAEPTYDPNSNFIQQVYDFEIKAGYLKGKTMDNFLDLKPLNEVLTKMGKPTIK